MRVFALIALIAALGAAPAGDSGARVGSPAPAIRATTLSGAPLGARATAGKITVLNFWATWCPPCRAETPQLNAAYAKLHAPDVAFLGIDTTETAPIVKTFLSAKGVPYPAALAGPELYNAYGISFIPTTLVIDAHGVVRARWVGEVTPAQLSAYVADARAGRNAVFVSATQREIDRMLDPAQYPFRGSDAQRSAALAKMQAAFRRADALEDKNQSQVDDERTEREGGVLRVQAGLAMTAAAKTPAQRAAGLAMTAQGYGDQSDWTRAAALDRQAVALAPKDASVAMDLRRDYYRLHDYRAMIAEAQRYTRMMPRDGDGWSDLGLAYQRIGRMAAAVAPYETSLHLLEAAAAKAPTQDAIADVADTALDAANVYVALGDRAHAASTFAIANAYGDRLAAGGKYAELKHNVKERTQEGLIAVNLAGGNGKPVLSVAPWTGPDLPGSLGSTLKYRLIVAAAAGKNVALSATGAGKDWVSSFCADGLCSPERVSFRTPPAGVKTYEFQLVPPESGARPGTVVIHASGGNSVTVPAAR